MTKRRDRGDGGIDERGPNNYRLRYRIKGQRFSVTFHGTLQEARKKLRALLRSGDTGEHVAPDKITVAQWIEEWLANGAQGKKALRKARRSLVRYEQLLRVHVLPALGTRPIQAIQPTEIDALYRKLRAELSPRTAHSAHTIFRACLNKAVSKGIIAVNPIDRADEIPSPGEADHGTVLDQDQLRTLIEGFRGSVMFPIVCVAAFTGARRNEILALRWSDFDESARTLRIERAIESIGNQPLALKEPKTKRGKRTITIDDDLTALFVAQREKHRRLTAAVPDGAAVEIMVKLPEEALMFPSPPEPGESFSFTKLRNPDCFTQQFLYRARKLGFPNLRLHDLRGTHETLLLDAGVPIHVVAARCGHDPAVLLRSYAKRTRKADTSAAAIIGALSKGVLR
jgi:integrase